MLVEIFYPSQGTFCTFEPHFDMPYRLVHTVEASVQALREALGWTWRYANIVRQGDPWIRTGPRSAMVGDVFLVKGEAHEYVRYFNRGAYTGNSSGGFQKNHEQRKPNQEGEGSSPFRYSMDSATITDESHDPGYV